MYPLRSRTGELRKGERGFTLPELLIIIVIMGILFAIATSVWTGVTESRKVDSAANQLASDMRLAHTRATNQLSSWEVVFTDGSRDYELKRLGPPGGTVQRSLEDGAEVGTDVTIRFAPDGSAETISGSGNTVRVASANDASKYHDIEFNAATSRVEIV